MAAAVAPDKLQRQTMTLSSKQLMRNFSIDNDKSFCNNEITIEIK